MHDMNTPDRRNAGYVSTLFASEPALLDRLVDAVTADTGRDEGEQQ